MKVKPTIVHCVRKSSHIEKSFIFNQVNHPLNFQAIIFCIANPLKNEHGFENSAHSNFTIFYPGDKRSYFRKLIFRYFKRISKKESQELIRFAHEHNCKGFHFHFGTDATIFWRLIRFSGLPSVVSFYGYDCSSFPLRFMGLGKSILQNKVFNYATLILAMSPDMKSDLISLGCPEEKIVVHYHGIDVHKYKNQHLIIPSKRKITLLTAGRLDEKKGHLFLIKAIELIKKESKINVEWVIAGDGAKKEIISQQIISCHLQKEVHLYGAYSYNSDTLNRLFAETDIYIQPSITAKDGDKEGIPGTLVEAMAAGLPVISTYHAGIPCIIEDGINGLLVKEWDVHALKEAILLLCNDPELRNKIGKEARRFAMENLDLQIKESELESIYDRVLNIASK